MVSRYFALIAGIVYFIVGVLGFTPGATNPRPTGAPELTVESYYGYVFGLFPVNAVHNVLHIVVGVLGLIAYRRFTHARVFARALAIAYGLLAIMGLIPGLNTALGYAPITATMFGCMRSLPLSPRTVGGR